MSVAHILHLKPSFLEIEGAVLRSPLAGPLSASRMLTVPTVVGARVAPPLGHGGVGFQSSHQPLRVCPTHFDLWCLHFYSVENSFYFPL